MVECRFDFLGGQFGDDIFDALRIGMLLGHLHDQASDGNATGRAQVSRFIVFLEMNATRPTHHQFCICGVLNLILDPCDLSLQGTSPFTKRNDVGSWDGGVFGGIVIDTSGIAAFARGTLGYSGVASRFPLSQNQYYLGKAEGEKEGKKGIKRKQEKKKEKTAHDFIHTCLHLVHAVRVCAIRLSGTSMSTEVAMATTDFSDGGG